LTSLQKHNREKGYRRGL